MIVRNVSQLEEMGRVIHGTTWTSKRMLLKEDGMGFSFHETIIRAGTETHMHYRNHLEAVYCVGGKGQIKDLATGVIHEISDGTMYALSDNDKHILYAEEDLRLICVFNPPLVGPETHDESGCYPLIET